MKKTIAILSLLSGNSNLMTNAIIDTRCFPKTKSPSRLVRDGEYLVSYYTGPYSSYIKEKEDVRWTTPSFYVDLKPIDVTVQVPTKGSISRSSPSLLDENTMFYTVSNGFNKEHNSCVFRATATGDFPKKTWTE